MSKETIHHSCGHTSIANIVGNVNTRKRRAIWMGEKPCPDCERASFDAARKAESEASAKANADAGLPALEGTPKQIAWAESIRASALAHPDNSGVMTSKIEKQFVYMLSISIKEKREAYSSSLGDFPDKAELRAAIIAAQKDNITLAISAIRDEMLAARMELQRNNSAKWWIDNQRMVNETIAARLNEQAAKWISTILASIPSD